jgi:hypothetical protein
MGHPFVFVSTATDRIVLGSTGDVGHPPVGQNVGANTNINYSNFRQLCNINNGCNINNYLSNGVTVTLNGCRAGADVSPDLYAQYSISVAKMLSMQLARKVYAYKVGIYFSQQDAQHDNNFSGTSVTKALPDSLPMYMVPEGTPGQKKGPTQF